MSRASLASCRRGCSLRSATLCSLATSWAAGPANVEDGAFAMWRHSGSIWEPLLAATEKSPTRGGGGKCEDITGARRDS